MRVGELSADGWRFEPPLTQIFPGSLAYSAAGLLAYVGRQSEKHVLLASGTVVGDGYDGISDELGWSASGQEYSFVAMRGADAFVVSEGEEWAIEGQPLPRRFVQNRDGSQIAWLTGARTQKLFVNGHLLLEAKEFIENPVWSPNGERLAFAYLEPRGLMLRVDERDYGPYPSLNKGTPVWSPDSRRCGWVIQRKGKSVVIIDGEEFPLPYSVVQGGTLAFSPDGSRWALAARTGLLNLKGCAVVDGESGPVYTGLGTTAPVWSPSGDALAYFALRGLKTTFIVCDGREGQHCTAFIDGSLTWHPDGEVVGCIAQQDNKPCIVLEERDGRSWSLRPEGGNLLAGGGVAFDEDRSLHDLGIRNDFSLFGWTARF